MNQNPTVEQPVPVCCYCGQSSGIAPTTTYGGSLIHQDCLELLHIEMDQHREESAGLYEEYPCNI